MKKEEKTKRTYEKIVMSAIVEFGSKNYENASLTTICNTYQISKGLLYHNFKSKDELYLKCVEFCFKEMTDYISSIEYNFSTIKESIEMFLSKRQQFFRENPYYAKIFFNAVLHPPSHLKKEIQNIRQEFDTFSKSCYKKILDKVTLREGLTIDLAIEYLIGFQEMFNAYFQSKTDSENNFQNLVQEHELNLSKILDIILYGMIEK